MSGGINIGHKGVKSGWANGHSTWDGEMNQNLRVLNDHSSAILAQGVPVTPGGSPPAAPPGVATLYLDGTYSITDAVLGSVLYSAKPGVVASNGLAVFVNTGSGWVNTVNAAALTQSLLLLASSGVVGNVLAISAAGVASWVPDKQTEVLASGPGYRAIRHSDGTIVQTGIVYVTNPNGAFVITLPVTFPNGVISDFVNLRISGGFINVQAQGSMLSLGALQVYTDFSGSTSYSYQVTGY